MREFEVHPTRAADAEIRALRSPQLPETDVHIVSGRRRRELEQWFGRLPVISAPSTVSLARAPGESGARSSTSTSGWLRPIERLLPKSPRRPAHVERKSCSGLALVGRPSPSTDRGVRASS
jgi:hypothetical protein